MLSVVNILASQAAAPAEPAYATLYATCAALMIAVLVVFYFDQRVRDRLTVRQRGYAIGSLGGIIGTGMLLCLFVLAGITADTTGMRIFITVYTLVFLTLSFGAAITIWAREDAAALQATAPPMPALPPVPIPSGGTTERERAAETLGSALTILMNTQPDVTARLAENNPTAEVERLRGLSLQWLTLQPAVVSISAGYPSADVRQRTTEFWHAANVAMRHTTALLGNKQTLIGDQARAEWHAKAAPAYTAAAEAWQAVVDALHPDQAKPQPHRAGKHPSRQAQAGL